MFGESGSAAALVEKYKDYDPEAYSASIADEMKKKSEAAKEWESFDIFFIL